MTTHQLAELLLKQPNIPVFTYIQEAEEYSSPTEVKFYQQGEDLPYAKSDSPTNPETGLVLIEGWCM